MSDSARRTHPAAIVAFLLGVASLALMAATGIPALVVGLRALRAVNASDGRLRGARLALAGLVLGGIGTAITVLGAGAIVAIRLRETSNQVECADHLRRIGLSLNKYADIHGTFPPATRDPHRLAPDQRLSWLADVVPLLDEGTPRGKKYQDLAGRIDRTKGWDAEANRVTLATPVRIFLCPGHPDFNPNRSPGLTDYVGVAGINPQAAYLKRDDPRAGMFGHDRGVRRQEITGGISFTMMVLETAADNGPWLAGGFPTVRGLDPEEEHYSGPGRPFGGLHRNLLNVLYVDGSVRPLSDATEGRVFRALATIHRRDEAPK